MFEGFDKERLKRSAKHCGTVLAAELLLFLLKGWTLVKVLVSACVAVACFGIALYKSGEWVTEDEKAFPRHIRSAFRRAGSPIYREGQTGQNTTMAEFQMWFFGGLISIALAICFGAW